MILEFKMRDAEDEATLPGTVAVVLKQIEEKKYSAGLNSRGIQAERIRSHGFAFRGQTGKASAYERLRQ